MVDWEEAEIDIDLARITVEWYKENCQKLKFTIYLLHIKLMVNELN